MWTAWARRTDVSTPLPTELRERTTRSDERLLRSNSTSTTTRYSRRARPCFNDTLETNATILDDTRRAYLFDGRCSSLLYLASHSDHTSPPRSSASRHRACRRRYRCPSVVKPDVILSPYTFSETYLVPSSTSLLLCLYVPSFRHVLHVDDGERAEGTSHSFASPTATSPVRSSSLVL